MTSAESLINLNFDAAHKYSAPMRNSLRVGLYVTRTACSYLSRLQPFLFGSALACPTRRQFVSIMGFKASAPLACDNRLVANPVFLTYNLRNASGIGH
jgi:hypothetical protein